MLESKYAVELKTGMDLAALVDVVFLLLAYFLINTTLIKTATIDIDLPGSSSSHKNQAPAIVLQITQQNQIKIDSRIVELEDLDTSISRLLKNKPKSIFTIQAHKDSKYQSLISVLDHLKNNGIKNINLETSTAISGE